MYEISPLPPPPGDTSASENIVVPPEPPTFITADISEKGIVGKQAPKLSTAVILSSTVSPGFIDMLPDSVVAAVPQENTLVPLTFINPKVFVQSVLPTVQLVTLCT